MNNAVIPGLSILFTAKPQKVYRVVCQVQVKRFNDAPASQGGDDYFKMQVRENGVLNSLNQVLNYFQDIGTDIATENGYAN